MEPAKNRVTTYQPNFCALKKDGAQADFLYVTSVLNEYKSESRMAWRQCLEAYVKTCVELPLVWILVGVVTKKVRSFLTDVRKGSARSAMRCG